MASDQPFHVVSKRFANFEDRAKVFSCRPDNSLTLVRRPSDLIEVPADRTEFSDASLQSHEFVLGERRKVPQVSTHEHSYVGRRRHTSCDRPFAKQ
jgi:hypothetical protein